MKKTYYVPPHSYWPILTALFMGMIAFGLVHLLHKQLMGIVYLSVGALGLCVMLVAWFKDVIHESQSGLYNKQMDHSFRWGMVWFIFSEIMFFAAFFAALFYARFLSVPWLGGLGSKLSTHTYLWPQFIPTWPLLKAPDPLTYTTIKAVINTWGLPAVNTLILLSSGVTITWAHWSLLHNRRRPLMIGLGLTLSLGLLFISLQLFEYYEAYTHLNLTLKSGIYGSTFFLLTGFHGLHVMIGSLMLFIILMRVRQGHFNAQHHFAFEGVSWYWHFIDVVWLLLFIFVYWL